MGDVLRGTIEGDRFLLRMISLFAVIATVLAMGGIFGAMSHNVAQRTREIGVRVAFGAHDRRILMLIVRDALFVNLVGIAIGFVLLFLFAAVLRSQLYGVGPLNLGYAGIAVLLLAGVTLIATVIPALRAARVDPMKALRFE
jgi:ABC-type antimicrobial peptide transport system permease subunit